MIQDILPYKMDNHYYPDKRCRSQDLVICLQDGKMLVKNEDGVLKFPCAAMLSSGKDYRYLFNVAGEDYYLLFTTDDVPAAGYQYLSLKEIRFSGKMARHLVFAGYTACHLARWYMVNTFCGHCGTRTEHSAGERAVLCPACGVIKYPQINPAVIVGIIDQERILLTKYANRDISYYALVAGFTEIGETLEECIRREVKEEVGLSVKNIRYYKSQPWGCAGDLLMGFFCNLAGEGTICLDRNELKEAVWVKREDVPGQPDDFSLTNEMMMAFKQGLIE